MKRFKALLLIVLIGALYSVASAEENQDAPTIMIKDHRFIPEELKIPAGKKVKILVKNQDTSPEEFESYELRREKVVSGRGEITVFIGPLKPGIYKYFGDFHPQTAQGRIVAEENS